MFCLLAARGPQGNTDSDQQDPGRHPNLGADREGRQYHFPYGLLAPPDAERLSHVSMSQLPDIVAELHPEGAVQSVQLPQPSEHLFVQDVVLAELDLQGVAGGVKPKRKRYEQDCQQDRKEEYNSPERVCQHILSLLPILPDSISPRI